MAQAPYNSVFRFQASEETAETALDEVFALYSGRDVTMAFVVHPSAQPGDLRERLVRRGLELAEAMPAMALDLTTFNPDQLPVPAGIAIGREAASDDSDWMEMVSERYGLDPSAGTYLESVFASGVNDGRRIYVARRDGVALSKVVAFPTDDVVGIYGVSTREAGRGLGLASLLMSAALRDARDEGCALATLQSTPMAHDLYRRLGFKDVGMFELWAAPDAVHL
jgi:GNAT superfamily N-acetyltransferase